MRSSPDSAGISCWDFWTGNTYSASKFALEAFTESLAQEAKGYGVKVALVEPGIIDTPMATTNLPQYDANTIYPHGRRLSAFFTNPAKPEPSPTLVGEMIRNVIERDADYFKRVFMDTGVDLRSV